MNNQVLQQPVSNLSSEPKILCVDDEPSVRESIAAYLEDSGFVVIEAENGRDALEKFDQEQPALVLSDLDMPVMGGLDFIDALSKKSPHTPVIVISGAGVMKDAIEALRLGAWDYLLKPITDMTILEHSVCKALERARLVAENEIYKQELEATNNQLAASLDELRQDQKAGRRVQQRLLPRPTMVFGEYNLSYQISPSLYLSGDFVDYAQVSDSQVVFYIADVSGHGASSAFVTVWLKSLINQALAAYQRDGVDTIVKPEAMLKHLSDEILSARLEKYLTIIYCVLDMKSNTLDYCTAGHHPQPILWDGKQTKFLEGNSFAVGVYDKAEFEVCSIALPDNFTLAMFSDGILEIVPKADLEGKEEFLRTRIGQYTTLDDIFRSLKLNNLVSLPDDITVLLVSKQVGKK